MSLPGNTLSILPPSENESGIYDLINTTLNRIESQHILRELKRNKTNTKKIVSLGLFYGDILERPKTKEIEQFHTFLDTFNVSRLINDNYKPNKYKTDYQEFIQALEDGWIN